MLHEPLDKAAVPAPLQLLGISVNIGCAYKMRIKTFTTKNE